MTSTAERVAVHPTHAWLKQMSVAYVPGDPNPVIEAFVDRLLAAFSQQGHEIKPKPHGHTDILLTTARYGEPRSWRKAPIFFARKQYQLDNHPTVFTVMHLTVKEYEEAIEKFTGALEQDPPDATQFSFEGLAPQSAPVFVEQGRRGGPLLALVRQVQAQSKSIKMLMVVGDDEPQWAHYFDLVGAHPTIHNVDPEAFYTDLVLRMVTVMSTYEVTQHEVIADRISEEQWRSLEAPNGMLAAGPVLGERDFFTDMVRIADLVQVPAVAEGVAEQYSEGCFATWDPALGALIATVTGSARPVEKDAIGEDDLAVIVGVREDGKGAIVQHVDGKGNDPPSSEAVELKDMDSELPQIELDPEWGASAPAPVVRSKLHGHRGVSSYDPQLVEFAPLDPPYHHYPVSCATAAQALGIKLAFSRAESLLNPDDPRVLAFTVLPGHGVIIAEKWVAGTAAFQTMWEAMDSGALKIDNYVPQAYYGYRANGDGQMVLTEE